MPDPHPDSLPQDNHDRRSDLEQAVTGTNEDIEQVHEADGATSEVSPEGAGGENGAGGVVKNQEDLGQ